MRAAALLVLAAIVGCCEPAFAVVDVDAESVWFEWTPSTGPAEEYLVLTSWNDGLWVATEIVGENRAQIFRLWGGTVRVKVLGLAAGRTKWSPPSETSEPVRFADTRPPPSPPTPVPEPWGHLQLPVGLVGLAMIARHSGRRRETAT